MRIEIVGKFYDNHSLSIINRKLAIGLSTSENMDVHITPLDSFDPAHKLSKRQARIIKNLEAKEQSEPPEIQIRHCYPPVWAWPVHEMTKVIYIQPWEYGKAPFEWQYKFETFADALIVPSNYIASVFKQGGLDPDNIFVVPNGFDDAIFNKEEADDHPLIKKDRFNFVYVGNTQWRKGLDIMLNSWSKVFKKYDKTTLIIKDNPAIYGKNNAISEIIKMQYKTGCAEIIYIDDALSDKEMAQLFKLSKAVVHPYRAEGFGMHIQEAFACGCIPIVSADGPTEDFIPSDIGFRINVEQKPIDIMADNIFAAKSGDAMTMMSSHSFANEPSGQHLEKILQYVYHHHDKNVMLDAVNNVKLENTWENVINHYIKAIENVYSRNKVNRFRN